MIAIKSVLKYKLFEIFPVEKTRKAAQEKGCCWQLPCHIGFYLSFRSFIGFAQHRGRTGHLSGWGNSVFCEVQSIINPF